MLTDYTFLTDHSYSLRPDTFESNETRLHQRQSKGKKRRRSSNRTSTTVKPAKSRKTSLHRNSSDKENTSLVIRGSNEVVSSGTSISTNSIKQATKKKKTQNRVIRRTSTNSSPSQLGKTQRTKILPKVVSKPASKKKTNTTEQTESLNSSETVFNVAPPALSIEERVKLRRTKPVQPSTSTRDVKPTKKSKSQRGITESNKKTVMKTPLVVSKIKSKRLFLGSGLDLDNIVLGNRQRRTVQD